MNDAGLPPGRGLVSSLFVDVKAAGPKVRKSHPAGDWEGPLLPNSALHTVFRRTASIGPSGQGAAVCCCWLLSAPVMQPGSRMHCGKDSQLSGIMVRYVLLRGALRALVHQPSSLSSAYFKLPPIQCQGFSSLLLIQVQSTLVCTSPCSSLGYGYKTGARAWGIGHPPHHHLHLCTRARCLALQAGRPTEDSVAALRQDYSTVREPGFPLAGFLRVPTRTLESSTPLCPQVCTIQLDQTTSVKPPALPFSCRIMDEEDESPGLLRYMFGFLARNPPRPIKKPKSLRARRQDAWLRTDAFLQHDADEFDDMEPEQRDRTLRALEGYVEVQTDGESDFVSAPETMRGKLRSVASL